MHVCKYMCNLCQGTSLIVYIFPSPPPSVHDIHAFKTKEVGVSGYPCSVGGACSNIIRTYVQVASLTS